MKAKILHAGAFACKSLLWSLALYVVCMLAINWDDLGQQRQTLANDVAYAKIALTQTPSVNASNDNYIVSESNKLLGKAMHILQVITK